jgi:ribosomal protein L13
MLKKLCYLDTGTKQSNFTKNTLKLIQSQTLFMVLFILEDLIQTQMVRGMIPKRKSSGIEAFKRLRVYIGIPESLKNSEMKYYDDSKITKPSSYYITVGEVAKEIGWSGGVEPIYE